MCEFCENEIYRDSDEEFFLQVESSHWDGYYECYERVKLWGVKYCPYCGMKLGDEDEV